MAHLVDHEDVHGVHHSPLVHEAEARVMLVDLREGRAAQGGQSRSLVIILNPILLPQVGRPRRHNFSDDPRPLRRTVHHACRPADFEHEGFALVDERETEMREAQAVGKLGPANPARESREKACQVVDVFALRGLSK